MTDVDRLVARVAPDPGPGLTPLGRELMEQITSAPVAAAARPRRSRRWFAVPALAVLTVVLSWLFPVTAVLSPAAAALDIKEDDGHYVITVTDLLADPEVYQAELRARGLDITLTVAPTSAAMTGVVFVINDVDGVRAGAAVPADGPITSIAGPGPCTRFGGCPVGIKVPIDFTDRAELILGRRARPGERYELPPPIDRPGEPLHCVEFVNKTVAEVTPMLRRRGVEPEFTSSVHRRPVSSVPSGWYVHDGVMKADGQALILTDPRPAPDPRPMDASCRNPGN